MDLGIAYVIKQTELSYNEEKDELAFVCQVPTAAEMFRKLLNGASQAGIIAYEEGEMDGQSVIGIHLQNANGEMVLALRQPDWESLTERPDTVAFQFGEGEADRFSTTFLNRLFDEFVDKIIARYNEGDVEPFTLDIIHAFAEEE
jgi:hypothetical protein